MRVRFLALGFLAALSLAGPALADLPASSGTPGPGEKAAPHTVVAYYLHGEQRCKTCLHIESSAEKTLRGSFRQEMQAGRLAWRTANFDKPENEHFVKDFGLVTSSVVLVEMAGNRVVRFKVLDKVWQYARDDHAFEAYVQRETAAFLKTAPPDRG